MLISACENNYGHIWYVICKFKLSSVFVNGVNGQVFIGATKFEIPIFLIKLGICSFHLNYLASGLVIAKTCGQGTIHHKYRCDSDLKPRPVYFGNCSYPL